MKIVIDIPDNEIPTKQDIISVELNCMDGKICACNYPFVEMKEDNEYQRFAEFVVETCTSFAESNEDKAKDIINEIIYKKKKYPKLSLLWDQYCGNFS